MSFLNLHRSQIDEIVAAAGAETTLAVKVKASPEARAMAINACSDAGIEIPTSGVFTQAGLDAVLDEACDKSHPLGITRRLELKTKIYAGGLVLEPSNIDQRAVVTAGLMLRKAGIPLPEDKPYTLAQIDNMLAAAQLSPLHRIEIKSACIQAGLVQDEPRRPVATQLQASAQVVQAAAIICGQLGLDVPKSGEKLNIGRVDAAMDSKGWTTIKDGKTVNDIERRVRTKQMLEQAGMI
jgi:hypothetical protein